MITKKIKTKNRNSAKYKKDETLLTNLKDFEEEKIEIAVLLEQGNDYIIFKDKTQIEREYAIIKVYFKDKWQKNNSIENGIFTIIINHIIKRYFQVL